ncbi:hypothetical protein KCV00_g28, partial [Aureobasidium melanogenum]
MLLVHDDHNRFPQSPGFTFAEVATGLMLLRARCGEHHASVFIPLCYTNIMPPCSSHSVILTRYHSTSYQLDRTWTSIHLRWHQLSTRHLWFAALPLLMHAQNNSAGIKGGTRGPPERTQMGLCQYLCLWRRPGSDYTERPLLPCKVVHLRWRLLRRILTDTLSLVSLRRQITHFLYDYVLHHLTSVQAFRVQYRNPFQEPEQAQADAKAGSSEHADLARATQKHWTDFIPKVEEQYIVYDQTVVWTLHGKITVETLEDSDMVLRTQRFKVLASMGAEASTFFQRANGYRS